jgi:phenylacetate-CoA ligase
LQRLRPTSIYGYASALETFSRFVEDNRIDLGLPERAVIIPTSEPLFESQRELYRRVLSRHVANEYGSCEAGLLGFDCPAGKMHLLEDTTLVEVLDSEGRSLEQGVGEIVVTSLYSDSVPLIRYRLGDVARLSTEVCTCGRRGRLLEAIEGRTWSMLRGTNGSDVYPQVVTQVVFGFAPEARRFQAVQDRADHVLVKLAAPKGIAPERTRGISAELTKMLGPGMCVDVEVVERIEPGRSGKFVPVKSLLASSG